MASMSAIVAVIQPLLSVFRVNGCIWGISLIKNKIHQTDRTNHSWHDIEKEICVV
jgi:hypothetical protein